MCSQGAKASPLQAPGTLAGSRVRPCPGQALPLAPSCQVLEGCQGSNSPAPWNRGQSRKPEAEAWSPGLSHANDMQNWDILASPQRHDCKPGLPETPRRQILLLPQPGRNCKPFVSCLASPRFSDVPRHQRLLGPCLAWTCQCAAWTRILGMDPRDKALAACLRRQPPNETLPSLAFLDSEL